MDRIMSFKSNALKLLLPEYTEYIRLKEQAEEDEEEKKQEKKNGGGGGLRQNAYHQRSKVMIHFVLRLDPEFRHDHGHGYGGLHE